MRQLHRTLRALGALLLLLLLLLGVPAALAATGNPLSAVPDLIAGNVTDTALVAVLAAVAWVAWAQFALATVAELIGAVRRGPAPRIPGVLRSQQQLARALVLTVFVLGSAGSLLTAAPSSAGAAAPGRAPVGQLLPAAWQSPLSTHPSSSTANAQEGTARQEQATALYTVPPHGQGPGTLWDIAQDRLGSGARWHEIWHLNEGRQQPGGARMTSPSRLRPGWTVLIPSDAPGSTTSGANTTDASSGSVAVTVQVGDSLAGLASEHGQSDWHQAWHDNAGRTEPSGQHFTDPDLLRPGWTVALPGPGTPSAVDRTAAPPQAAPATPATPALPRKPHRPAGQPAAPTRPEPAPQHGLGAAPQAPVGPQVRVLPVAPAPAPPPAQPVSPAPTAAVGAPAPGSPDQQRNEHAGRDTDRVDAAGHVASPVATVALLGGGGAILAAGVVLVLLRLRRRQFRERTLGRTISSTPYALAPMEKALLARSVAGIPDVNWLDAALQHLVQATGAQGTELPEVVAARLTPTALELVLTAARPEPPAPWQADDSGLRWTVHRRQLDATQPLEVAVAAGLLVAPPYPALVSVGYSDGGDHWLLDLERLGAVSLSGDRERCLNLARFLAAELAHNSWAELLRVDLVGFGAELAPLDRVTHHHDGAAAVRSVRGSLRDNARVLHQDDSSVLHDRVHIDGLGDGWPPRVLLVAPQVATGEQPGDREGLDALQGLLEAMRAQRSRTAVAVVVAGDGAHTGDTRWQLHVDEHGRLTIPALDLTLTAQQVPVEEAADLAALIALAAAGTDVPMPAAGGDQRWDALTDAAGALLPELVSQRDRLEPSATGGVGQDDVKTSARSVVTDLLHRFQSTGFLAPVEADESTAQVPGQAASRVDQAQLDEALAGGVTSVLPGPAAAYLPVTATTVPDVVALAPAVSAQVREGIEADSPGLAADLAAWRDSSSGAAKLTLLGPVRLTAPGTHPDKRVLFYTEVVAYLTARPLGVTAAELAADFWPDESNEAKAATRVRNTLSPVRTWLGQHPQTGEPHLPAARRDVGAGVYQLQGLLVDAELFRRLRLRGVARSDAGVVDLQQALALVVGPPLQHRRENGYGWLVDTPLEHQYTAAIVDTAHLVAVICLAAGDPAGAEAAARVSLLAGDTSDVALLDLVAAYDAIGDRAQAQAHVRRILANHEAEVEEDLPPRTYEVLRRRQWLPVRGSPQTG